MTAEACYSGWVHLVSPRGFRYSLFDASERRPTNWQGRPIDRSARAAVTVDNQVRVQIVCTPDKGSSYSCSMYFRVLEVAGDQLVGVCADPYYGEDPSFPFQNGDRLEFERKSIIEIPTDWASNGNLAELKATSELSLFPTGTLSDGKSVFEMLDVDVPALESVAIIETVAKHPDYLVRWLLLDCLAIENPSSAKHSERWAEVDRVLAGFSQDSFPALRVIAAFVVEDRRLNQAIWQRRGTDKKDPEYTSLRKANKAHRKRRFPGLCDLVSEFTPPTDGDLRAALDQYLAGRLVQLG
jgi:hypothetical protein